MVKELDNLQNRESIWNFMLLSKTIQVKEVNRTTIRLICFQCDDIRNKRTRNEIICRKLGFAALGKY